MFMGTDLNDDSDNALDGHDDHGHTAVLCRHTGPVPAHLLGQACSNTASFICVSILVDVGVCVSEFAEC